MPRDADHLAAVPLAHRCANYLCARGEYAEAERLCADALAIVEAALDPDDPGVVKSLNNLAVLYMELGRFRRPSRFIACAGGSREGPARTRRRCDDAPQPRDARDGVGPHCRSRVDFWRALAIREKLLARITQRHLWLTGLGILRGVQGRYAEAESLLSRVLATREQALGPNHPDVA